MRIKFEASVKRSPPHEPMLSTVASPWWGRRITVPILWAATTLTAVLVMAVIILILAARLSRTPGTYYSEPKPAAASFLKRDPGTQGSWRGIYGAQGSAIPNDSTHLPRFAEVKVDSEFTSSWLPSTNDVRAVQKASAPDRIASAWGSWSKITLDLKFSNPASFHRLSLYFVDWDSSARVENIEIVDALSKRALDVRQLSGFTDGAYLVWNLSGHVVVRITRAAGANAILSGIFLD